MYVHEICAKGGFRKELYLKIHFQRRIVSGWINGCIAPPKEKLNEIIGFTPKNIEMEQPHHPREEMQKKYMNIPMFNPFSEGSADDPLPLDYLPK